MGENSKIEWTKHTFNAWIGCTKVSPGCANCYAEALDHRWGGDHWGAGKPRKVMRDAYWREPLKWDKAAMIAGERHRVFCSSLADVFDEEAPAGQRERLFELIRQTQNLDWLLLTKRPRNIEAYLPEDWDNGYRNVWLGATVENQAMANLRVNVLLNVPAEVHFLSVEPLLEPIDLQYAMFGIRKTEEVGGVNAIGFIDGLGYGLDWVIVGAESGAGARPMNEEWVRDLRNQCKHGGVKFFYKQKLEGRKKVGLPVLDGRQWAELPEVTR